MRVNAGVHWKQISSKKKKSLSYCSLPCHHILWNLRSNEIMITIVFTVIVTIVIRMLILSYHLPFSSVQHGHQQTLQPVKLSQILNQTFTVPSSCLDFTVCFYICLNSYCFILPFIISQVAYPLFLPLFLPLEMGSEEARKRCKGSQSKQNVTKWDLFDLDQIF